MAYSTYVQSPVYPDKLKLLKTAVRSLHFAIRISSHSSFEWVAVVVESPQLQLQLLKTAGAGAAINRVPLHHTKCVSWRLDHKTDKFTVAWARVWLLRKPGSSNLNISILFKPGLKTESNLEFFDTCTKSGLDGQSFFSSVSGKVGVYSSNFTIFCQPWCGYLFWLYVRNSEHNY